MPGKFFRKSVNLSATTDNKAGAYGFIPIQFLDLCSHLGSNLLHRRGNQLPDLLGWNCMGNTHNILICHFILTRRCQFHFLCSLKINQILLHDQLGQFIPCIWNHTISYDTSLSCDGNIRCSRSDIDQCNI